MFNLSSIIQESPGSFTCSAAFPTPAATEDARAAFIGPVRQISMFSDLYCTGSLLILETPDRETMLRIADILNHAIIWE